MTPKEAGDGYVYPIPDQDWPGITFREHLVAQLAAAAFGSECSKPGSGDNHPERCRAIARAAIYQTDRILEELSCNPDYSEEK